MFYPDLVKIIAMWAASISTPQRNIPKSNYSSNNAIILLYSLCIVSVYQWLEQRLSSGLTGID